MKTTKTVRTFVEISGNGLTERHVREYLTNGRVDRFEVFFTRTRPTTAHAFR